MCTNVYWHIQEVLTYNLYKLQEKVTHGPSLRKSLNVLYWHLHYLYTHSLTKCVVIGTFTSSPRKCNNAIVQVRAVGKMYGMYTLYPPVASPVIRQTKIEEPHTPVSALLRAHQCGILMVDVSNVPDGTLKCSFLIIMVQQNYTCRHSNTVNIPT